MGTSDMLMCFNGLWLLLFVTNMVRDTKLVILLVDKMPTRVAPNCLTLSSQKWFTSKFSLYHPYSIQQTGNKNTQGLKIAGVKRLNVSPRLGKERFETLLLHSWLARMLTGGRVSRYHQRLKWGSLVSPTPVVSKRRQQICDNRQKPGRTVWVDF